MKVQQETGMDFTQLHISQQLGLVDWQYGFDRFQFHNQLIFDYDIYSISHIQSYFFVNDGQRQLLLECQTFQLKFITQTFFVCGPAVRDQVFYAPR